MASGTPDLVFEVLIEERLVVSCQTRFNPSDAEWDSWLDAVAALVQRVGTVTLLVVTEGGHPTRTQTERLRARNTSHPLTAVVSSSTGMRFFISALSFVNPTIRYFSLVELDRAFEHVGLSPPSYERVRTSIEELRRRLGG